MSRALKLIFVMAYAFTASFPAYGAEKPFSAKNSLSSLSRREMLRCSLFLGLGAAVNTAVGGGIDLVTSREPEVLENGEEKISVSYSRTILETNLLALGDLIAVHLVPFLGNAAEGEMDGMIDESPFLFVGAAVVGGPTLEELLFRALPAWMFNDGWVTGLLSSVVFAGAHNMTEKGFDISYVPVTHFLGGVYFWYLMKERGLSHAVVSHMAHNNAAVVMEFLRRLFP